MKVKGRAFTPVVYTPVKKEVLSPANFKKVAASSGLKIKSSRFVLPSPGENGFGMFEVEYITPVLKPKNRVIVHG